MNQFKLQTHKKDLSNSSSSSFVPVSLNQLISSCSQKHKTASNQTIEEENTLLQNLIQKLKENAQNFYHNQNDSKLFVEVNSDKNDEGEEDEEVKTNNTDQNNHQQHIYNNSDSSSPQTPTSTTLVTNSKYQMVSIDKEEEDDDTPIVMKNLHTVKSLKKFFEIKANNKFLPNGATTNAVPKNSHMMNFMMMNTEKMILSGDDTSSSSSTSSSSENDSSTQSILQDLFSKDSNNSDSSSASSLSKTTTNEYNIDEDDNCNNYESADGGADYEATKSDNKKSLTPTKIMLIPPPPPMPEFLTSPHSLLYENTLKNARFMDNKSSSSLDPTKLNNAESSNLLPNHIRSMIAKQHTNRNITLHEKLIKEIHHKTLERSARKDLQLSLDKHGNLIQQQNSRLNSSTNKNKAFYNKMMENNNDHHTINYREVLSAKSKKFTTNHKNNVRKISNNSNSNNENDNCSEFISISQTTSAIQTQERNETTQIIELKNELNKSKVLSSGSASAVAHASSVTRNVNSYPIALQNNSSFLSYVDYSKRTASFRSDFSVRSTGSACSQRSMLSEARAKLEAYSSSNNNIRRRSSSTNNCLINNNSNSNDHMIQEARF